MRGCIAALRATPHDVASDVQVFDATARAPGFVNLTLRIGTDEIAIMLPAEAYNGARNVADAWTRLMDRRPMTMRRALVPETEGAA